MRGLFSFSKLVILLGITLLVVLMYGCGGGGGVANDPINAYTAVLHITGSVTASNTILADVGTDVLPNSGILAAVGVSNVEIFLEDNNTIKTKTDTSGKFDLTSVPAGSHRIIARLTNSKGQIFRSRSSVISVSESTTEGQTGALDLNLATLSARGILRNAQGQAIVNASINLWGETFTTNSSGEFQTPAMPQNSQGTLDIQIAGYQNTSVNLSFTSPNTPYIDMMLAKTGDTNRAPLVSLAASAYTVSNSGTIYFSATAADPENQTLTYTWSATKGTITANTGNLSATWVAPAQSGVATITFQAMDSQGLRSSYALGITVEGTGVTGDVTPPTVVSVSPASGTSGIALNSGVSITFSEAMDSTSLNADNIFILAGGATAVTGTLAVSSDKKIVTFTPSQNFQFSTTYTVTVTSLVKDAAGNALSSAFVWSFSTSGGSGDNVSPTILSTVPAEGAVGVSVGTTIRINFSEPLDSATVNTSSIKVLNGATLVAGSISLNTDNSVVTFAPSASFANGTTYTVIVTTAIKDSAGNAFAVEKSWNITTIIVPDTIAPTVVSVVPASGAANIAVASPVTITFSEPMNADSVNANTILLLVDYSGQAGTVTLSADRNQAIFTPASPMSYGTVYTVMVTTGAEDSSGNAIATSFSCNFTTAQYQDTIPPTIASSIPTSGAANVATNSVITVTFSEPMDYSTLNSTSINLYNGVINVPGVVSVNTERTIATFTPSAPLAYSTSYRVVVTTMVKDMSGNNMAADNAWNFTTVAIPDLIPPTIISVNPASGATNVAINTAIAVTFSEAMDSSTLNASNIFVSKSGSNIAGNISVTIDKTAVIFTPASELTVASLYDVTVTTGVKDATGNPIAALNSWAFTTASAPDTLAPTVASVVPASAAVNVSLTTSITVVFSEPMDPTTINTGYFSLIEGANNLSGVMQTNANCTIATFVPSAFLIASKTYTFVVSAAVKDMAGNVMGNDFKYNFNTTGAPDTVAPTVTAMYPASGATSIATNTAISVTFNEVMDSSTLNAANITLVKGATSVGGNITVGTDKMTATFTPSVSLSYESLYTVTVTTGVKDAAGNALATNRIWTFTTASAPDTVAPTVVSVIPASGSTNIALSSSVCVYFSEAMNSTTMNSGYLNLYEGINNLPGNIQVNANCTIATFTPSALLTASKTYNFTISAAVKDLAGNLMGNDFSYNFTTTSATDTVPPLIANMYPASGAVNIATNTAISISFNEAMDAATLNGSNITIKQGLTSIGGSIAVSTDKLVATFTPSSMLATVTLYTVTVATGVKDAMGNALAADRVWTFTTASATDTIPPAVTFVSPASGTVNVALSSTIGVVFSEPMDPTTINSGYLNLYEGINSILGNIQTNASCTNATFTPSSLMTASKTYTFIVSAAVKDSAGNVMGNDFSCNFNTTSASDTVAPVVSAMYPASAGIGIATNTAISVTFNEAMDNSSLNSLNIQLAKGATSIGGLVSVGVDNLVATFTPSSSLATASLYTVTIATGVKDLAGNPLAANRSWTFTTASDPDVIPPTVVSVIPASGSTNIATTTLVTIIFSEPMNAATINTANILLASGAISISGTTALSVDGLIATFTPSAPLAYEATYTVTVASGVKDLAANALAANLIWSFTTASAPETIPPTIVSFDPASGATNVATGTAITVTFSEPMNASTVSSATITLVASPSFGSYTVPGNVSLSTDLMVATFTPQGSLPPNATCTLSVNSGVKDIVGNPMGASVSMTFTTIPDTIPPTVIDVLPASGAENISIGSLITIYFSEPIDSSTAGYPNIRVASEPYAIFGTIAFATGDWRVATFTPSSPLPVASITVTIGNAVKDLFGGNPLLATVTYAFNTFADVTPPTVISFGPASGDNSLATSTPVSLAFSENIDPTTVNGSSILVASGSISISGNWTLSGKLATFTPASSFPYATITVTVTPAVKDTVGNAITASFSWDFMTLPRFVAVDGGCDHTLFLMDDGSIRSVGDNGFGQLGMSGVTITRYELVKVLYINDAVSISAGRDASFAIRSDGSLWGWGNNQGGEIGTGASSFYPFPIDTGFSNARQVQTGYDHVVALKNDGTVWAWGTNNNGQLGDGTFVSRFAPVQIASLSGITMISAGTEVSAALKNDGTVFYWGGNSGIATPTQITGLSNVVAVLACLEHIAGNKVVYSIKNDGTVWEFADQVAGFSQAVSFAGNRVYPGNGHLIVRKSDASLLCVGNNWSGSLGDGVGGSYVGTPFQNPFLQGIKSIGAGNERSFVIDSEGFAWAFGENGYGELGLGNTTDTATPTKVLWPSIYY